MDSRTCSLLNIFAPQPARTRTTSKQISILLATIMFSNHQRRICLSKLQEGHCLVFSIQQHMPLHSLLDLAHRIIEELKRAARADGRSTMTRRQLARRWPDPDLGAWCIVVGAAGSRLRRAAAVAHLRLRGRLPTLVT
jgi:hypothetical protein